MNRGKAALMYEFCRTLEMLSVAIRGLGSNLVFVLHADDAKA
jgi:hypothetical protein